MTTVVLVGALDTKRDDYRWLREELHARIRSLIRLKRYTDDLESAEAIIVSLALTIEARDAYTQGHCQRLAALATALMSPI